jgi:hypothetical protein
MHGQPEMEAGKDPGWARAALPDTAGNRRRAEALLRAADEARDRASALHAALAARRGGAASFRDQMAIWEETRRTLAEMEESARALAVESAEAERDAAEQTAWVRAQVESMLDSGWTREELAGIGIGDDLLAQVGLRDDPRLWEPGAGSRVGGARRRRRGST